MDVEKDTKQKRSLVKRPVGILKKQLGYTREFPHPNLVRIIIPTLPYEALDCSGEKILPWSLMKLFDSCEPSDFWPNQDEPKGPVHDKVLYMLNYELEIDEALYTSDSPKFPLIIDNTVKYVKRASRFTETILRHPEVERPYVRCSGVDVNMDPETRKPKTFPLWWKEHFNFPTEGPKREFKIPPKPAKVFSSEHRVYFSDTDENKHMNYTVYVRFCCDSFYENVLAGKYGASLDVYEIGVKKLQITYLKECNLGDILTVESWEDEFTKDTYHFEIWNGSDLSATVTISYYNFRNGQSSRL
ncbi:uncharacterized protein LOC123560542 isoform X2 [Mercenaria mercenaria]|uniref:uncharacterized protein LOC123560542 isoform X2 n=1 Tax=Mercenaria mercenaria TaxID=6596 RepID=UPI00234F41B2|nr:uncharacterized protein LOC123560542 isoform X2 [Mercenaria mercenaria]